MKLGIMQPYFFPYIGYWQLLNFVDCFVVYDDVEYTKKGWINRNRYLSNGKVHKFSIPIKKDSDHLFIKERFIADSFDKEKTKLIRKIKNAYRKSVFFDDTFDLVVECLNFKNDNLFEFILNSIEKIKEYLGINTDIYISSEIYDFTKSKGKDKVLKICDFFKVDTYINPIGGVNLYESKEFAAHGIDLFFLKSDPIIYSQFKNNEFIPDLSIIDVLMFNSLDKVHKYLTQFKLVK